MSKDSELLIGLSDGELDALADSMLAPGWLDELLARNTETQLSALEHAELDGGQGRSTNDSQNTS